MTCAWTMGLGAAACGLLLAAFGHAVSHSVDHGISAPIGQAVGVNLALLGVLAGQHGVMARPGLKRWWPRFVPPPIERSSYVLASAALAPRCRQW